MEDNDDDEYSLIDWLEGNRSTTPTPTPTPAPEVSRGEAVEIVSQVEEETEVIQASPQIAEAVKATAPAPRRATDDKIVEFAKEFVETIQPPLGSDQKAAFLGIIEELYGNGTKVAILDGFAGTGKTTISSSIVKCLHEFYGESAVSVYGAAFTNAAKGVLAASMADDDISCATDTIHGHIGTRIHKSIPCLPDMEFVQKALAAFPNPQPKDAPNPANEYAFSLFQVSMAWNEFVGNTPHKLVIIDEASMVSSMIYRLLLDRVNECPGAKMLFMGDALQVRPIEQAEDVLMEHAVKTSVAHHARKAGYDVDVKSPKKTIEEMIDFLLASDMENILLGSPETRNFECGARSVMEHDAHPRWILRENFRANKDSDNSLLELANILRKHSVNPSDPLKPNHQLSAECAAEVAEFLSQQREQILKISLEDSLRDIIKNPSEAFFIQDTNAKNSALNAECARRTTHLDLEVFNKTLRSEKQGLIDLVSKKDSILSPDQLLVIDDNKTVNSNIGQTKIWNGARVQVIESAMAVVQTGTLTWHTNVIIGVHGKVINSPIQDNMEVMMYFEANITENGALILKEIKPHYTADERVNPDSVFAYWNHKQGKVVDNLFGRYGSKLIKDQGFHDLVDLNARVEAKWHSTKPGGFSSSWSGDPEKFWISHISNSSAGAAYGWGLTIHKAQGSEYKRVHTSYGLVTGSGVAGGFQDSALSMIYTAVTRAKEHVCLIQEDFGQYGSYKHNTPAKPLVRNNNTSSPKRTMRALRRK